MPQSLFCLSIILYQNANVSIILVEPSNVPSLLTCHTTITGRNGEKKRTTGSACNDLTDFYGNYQPVILTLDLLAEFKVVISRSLHSDFISESHFGVTDATVHIRKESVQGNLVFLVVRKSAFDTHEQQKQTSLHILAVSPVA